VNAAVQVAQPACNPKQAHTTKHTQPHTHQEVVVLSNISLLQQEKTALSPKPKPKKEGYKLHKFKANV
jgi:hypothetical protein